MGTPRQPKPIALQKLHAQLLCKVLLCFVFIISFRSAHSQTTFPGIKINGVKMNGGETVQVCIGNRLVYENYAQGATQIFWKFKNGTPSNSTSFGQVIIQYNTASTDTTVQTVVNGSDTASTFVIIKVNSQKPTADYVFSPNNECGNVPVNFDGSGSTGTSLTYAWNFGDGGTSSAVKPSYQFLNAVGTSGTQNYSVKLVVTNNLNCADSVTKIVTVKKIPEAKLANPDPDVTIIDYLGVTTFRRCVNTPVYAFKFSNSSSTTAINTKYTIHWGDGSPDSVFTAWPSNQIITHLYTIGQHFLDLTVEGSTGCVGIKKYNIFLGTNPAGGFASPGNTNICSDNNLNFIISGYGNNPPGTSYTIVTTDGTPNITFQHPPPDTVSHVFSSGSCGSSASNGFQTYNNAYSSTLIIQNPCDITSIGVIPIYVSGKPKANISISPSTNVCTNYPVNFYNSSIAGGVITTLGGGNSSCSYTTKQVWTISPSTGYNVTFGSLGSINGAPTNSAIWTSGTSSINVSFSVAGTYTIKMYVGNDRCGVDSIIRTVCVRNPPKASFTLDKYTGCGPDTATVTNTSPVATCQGDTYGWTVSYLDPQNCGLTADYSFVSGTSNTSKNPVIRFGNAGRYIIRLTVTATGTSVTCPPSTFQDTFWVKAKPKAVINPIATVCIGNSISPTATVNNCYSNTQATYLWTLTGSNTPTSTSLAPGKLDYSAIGTYPIKLEATNECGTTIATDSAKIISNPTANAGGDKTVCSGDAVLVGFSGLTGVTYSWKPATFIGNANIPNPTITPLYNGPNADTTLVYVLTASAGANCSATDTVLITVRKSPDVKVTPTSTSICYGSNTTLQASGADTYLWNNANSLDDATKASVSAAPLTTTTYTVVGTAATGCKAQASAIVNVVSYPTTNAGNDTTVCNISNAIQLIGTPAGGTWSGSFITPQGIFNANAAQNGMHTVTYTASNGACSRADALVITVIDAPVVNAGNSQTICQSTTPIQLSGTPAGGRWSGSTFVTAGGLFTPGQPGTYNLTYTFGGGSCIATGNVTITVAGGLANNSINSDQSICTGTAPVTINGQAATGGNGGIQYQWQQSINNTSWTDIPQAVNQNYTPGVLSQSTWFRRIASTNVCNGLQANTSNVIKVTVNPDAQAQFDPTTNVGCIPFMLTPAVINLTVFGSVMEYRWYVNNNYIGSSQNFPGYTIIRAGDSAEVKLVAVSTYGCKNDTLSRKFYTVEKPQPAFTQSGTVGCGPLNISFTNTTPNAANYTWLWNFGQGQANASAQPGTITFPINRNYGDTLYTITQTVFSTCDTINVTGQVLVRAQPKALFTPNRSVGCSPMPVTFTNTSRGSNANYVWDFGDGSPAVTSNQPTVNHTFTAGVKTTFYVKLKGTNDCGADSLIYAIVVNPNSIKIDFAVNGNEQAGCAPHTVNFINNTIGASSFAWSFGDGDSLNTFDNVDTVSHTYTTSGKYLVKLLASNACNDTADTETINVSVKPAVSFTAQPTTTCVTDTILFSNTSDNGIAYLWRFGDGTTSVVRNAVKAYKNAGTYRVWLTGTAVVNQGLSCSDSTYADIIIRDTIPGSFTVSDSVGSCTPFNVAFTNTNPSSSSLWTFGDGASATGQQVNHTYTYPGNFYATLISKGNTGCTYKAVKPVVVTAPAGSLLYTGGFACTGKGIRFEVQAQNASRYTFVFGDGDSLITTNTVINHQYQIPGSYVPYAWLMQGNCRVKVFTGDTIKVDKITAGFASLPQYACGKTTLQFTDTSYAYFGLQAWQWNFSDGSTSSQRNPTKTYTQDASGFIRLEAIGKSGCSDTLRVPLSVHVQSYPDANIAGDSIGCTGQAVPLQAVVLANDSLASFNWSFGNGNSASGVLVQPVFNAAGIYNVRLIANTVFGCADTAVKSIRIRTSPTVSAGADVRICKGQSVRLNAVGATSWLWNPANNLSCTNCSNPLANPTISTAYVATGTNAAGCTTTDTVLVEVVQPFTLTVSANDTICTGGQTQLFASGATRYLWNPASGLSSATVANPIAKPASTTQYRVIAGDAYNCFADTGYVTVAVGNFPTVKLGNGAQVIAGTQVQFNPVITNGPIVQYAWTPGINLTCNNCPRPVATINDSITYKLEVENQYGCKASGTITYTVRCQEASQVFIPNAFSPDGDNINDILMVRGKGLATVKYFRIFNRWGELVFERNNIAANDPTQGWDGKLRGVAANPDVYVYTAEVVCTAGGVFTLKGNVTLFR